MFWYFVLVGIFVQSKQIYKSEDDAHSKYIPYLWIKWQNLCNARFENY